MLDVFPIFPLTGALLLPHGRLPLNIFEPRYLAMVDDAMRTHRTIGMIQSNGKGSLYHVGCLGRIVEYAETDDGRYLITLKGTTRFVYKGEQALAAGGYRQAQVDTTPYMTDKGIDEKICVDRKKLGALLKIYFQKNGMQCVWEKLDSVLDHELLTCLAMICPFSPQEKQALLEAYDDCARLELFMTMLDMETHIDCGCLHSH